MIMTPINSINDVYTKTYNNTSLLIEEWEAVITYVWGSTIFNEFDFFYTNDDNDFRITDSNFIVEDVYRTMASTRVIHDYHLNKFTYRYKELMDYNP